MGGDQGNPHDQDVPHGQDESDDPITDPEEYLDPDDNLPINIIAAFPEDIVAYSSSPFYDLTGGIRITANFDTLTNYDTPYGFSNLGVSIGQLDAAIDGIDFQFFQTELSDNLNSALSVNFFNPYKFSFTSSFTFKNEDIATKVNIRTEVKYRCDTAFVTSAIEFIVLTGYKAFSLIPLIGLGNKAAEQISN